MKLLKAGPVLIFMAIALYVQCAVAVEADETFNITRNAHIDTNDDEYDADQIIDLNDKSTIQDSPVYMEYFGTRSFRNKVLTIVKNTTTEAADLQCAVQLGKYHIRDLEDNTKCIHCETYCKLPPSAMMDVCLTKCRDYIERMDTERQMREIRAELRSLRNEFNNYKREIIINTILVLISFAVVIGFIFYIKNHMHKNYQHRFRQMQQSKRVPDGDNVDEAQPFEATLDNPQNGGFLQQICGC